VAELGMLRSISHPCLVQYLGCGINSEKQADGTVPKRYLSIVCPLFSLSAPLHRKFAISQKSFCFCVKHAIKHDKRLYLLRLRSVEYNME
jgi:hypothetical protein